MLPRSRRISRAATQCFRVRTRALNYFLKNLLAEINKHHGFEPLTLVLGLETVRKAHADNPFPEAVDDPQSLHLGFSHPSPSSLM